MTDDKPRPPARSTTFAGSSRSPDPPPLPSTALRHRVSQRQLNGHSSSQSQSPKPGISRRRSSLLSYSSIEDVTQALTEDFINPSMSRPKTIREEDEVTHWHSTPLAFALLPAVGGLLFKNGSAFITDILLITLAAIFMNWSIRLPWDWYYSAQAQRRDVKPDDDLTFDDKGTDDTAVESASSAGNSPNPSAQLSSVPETVAPTPEIERREEAAAELRRQEKLALFSTFLCPTLAAYLLHAIRGKLSSSSTGLVSDYNLAIFLLAAEIRPIRHLIRLATERTLHLQRTVTGLNDPFGSAVEEKSTISSLTNRISELEAKLADHTVVPQDTPVAQKTDISNLSTEMRKRYEPRLEGLERAVRRYEKRSTTLAMLTDQRLGSLETRLQDALSLAAAAAQQSQHRGAFATFLDSLTALILWPFKVAWTLAMSPLHVVEQTWGKLKAILVGASTQHTGKRRSGQEQKGKEKASTRKIMK